ncbi:MAG: metallophosphoesterase family protein [Planctomycetes bacterium]|nr:metallophosphoesterase family protein [Planctomycetota bacterium]
MLGRALPLLTLTFVIGCGGGGSSGGGASTAAGATAGTTTSPSAAIADVTSVRLPGASVLAGDVPVVFSVADPAGAPATVAVSYSVDGGASWHTATPAATSPGLSNLATGPAPGVEHTFIWATATDIPGLAGAHVRVARVGAPGQTADVAVVDNAPLNTAVRLNRRPYLQLTTQTSTIVCWRTEADTDSVIEWGPTPLLGQVAGNPGARAKSHDVEIVGLQPGTTYHYRVSSGGRPVTARGTFTTAPASNVADFTFLAFGDSGTASPEQLALGRRMATEQADFAIHTGDVIYPYGALANPVGEYNERFFRPYEDFLDRLPMFPVIGNHDLIALLGQPFKDVFHLPDNGSSIAKELYFSFEWGDAKFIALETTGLFLVPVGDHARWLQQEIQSNTKKWLIVYMHIPLYSCGSHGDNVVLQHVLGPQFENGKVDLVIAGHDHNYERTRPIKQFNRDPSYPGLVHVITGGGGAGLRGVNPNSRTAVAVRAHHYMKFRVQGDEIHGEAIDLNGQVIDAFTVQNIP